MSNLNSQIVDIINNFLEEYKLVDARTCEGEFKGMHSSLTVGGANEVVKEIEGLIAQQVREARIDELEHIVSGSEYSADDFDWYEITLDEYKGTNYYSEVRHLSKADRIAELRSKQ